MKWLDHVFLYNCLYTDCILVVRHFEDGNRSDRNILGKDNNRWLSVFYKFAFVRLSYKYKILYFIFCSGREMAVSTEFFRLYLLKCVWYNFFLVSGIIGVEAYIAAVVTKRQISV